MDKQSNIRLEGNVECTDTDLKQNQNIKTDEEVSGRKAMRKLVLHDASVCDSGIRSSNGAAGIPANGKCRKSENKYRIPCDPCRTERSFVTAEMYCQNCKEYFCKTCLRFHRKFSATAAHALQSIEDISAETLLVEESYVDLQNNIIKNRLYNMVPTHCIDINVQTADDKNDCNITGCELLSSGNLVLCDKENSAIKLLDMTRHQIIARFNLLSNPWDVTVTRYQDVAVSLPFEKTIQLFSISDAKFTCIRCLEVDGACLGLAYHNDSFIVSYSSKLEILSVYGSVKRAFSLKMDTKPATFPAVPWYIAVNNPPNCVYISYMDSNEISRLLINPVQYTRRLKDEDISYPAGMCVANGSELVVCNWDTHTIHLYGTIYRSGKRFLLDERDGLKHPQAVCYSVKEKKLYVSSYWQNGDPNYLNNIKVFNFMDMILR